MLSATDNELLTRTGPGTPMGDLFRRFWMPVLLSRELPERDGPPVRLKVMGEDLLAFRDSEGRVGVVEPHCPHRGANLFFGRNEECGIRCAYHGWKFEVTGRCVDMPTIPPGPDNERLRREVGLTAYPTREAAGMVWAYMGPPERIPALPQLEATLVPPTHGFVSKKLQECNWAQSCEGALDTAHFSFLHAPVARSDDELREVVARMTKGYARASLSIDHIRWMRDDGSPQYTIRPHPGGLVMGASRRADEGNLYWRVAQFLMPNHAFGPATVRGEVYHGQCWVPIDDVSCWVYVYSWNPERPLTERELAQFKSGAVLHSEVDENGMPLRNRSNDYLIDRSEQKRRSFTGIAGISEQDACIQDSQGRIADRTREHLGPTDRGIVRFRQLLLDSARALAAGTEPPAAASPESYYLRSGAMIASAATSFEAAMLERHGHPLGYCRR